MEPLDEADAAWLETIVSDDEVAIGFVSVIHLMRGDGSLAAVTYTGGDIGPVYALGLLHLGAQEIHRQQITVRKADDDDEAEG